MLFTLFFSIVFLRLRGKDFTQKDEMSIAVQLDKFFENNPPFNSIPRSASVDEFWSMAKMKGAKALASVVLPLLRITASEASAERTFSQQKMVHRPTRTSLSHGNVNAEVSIRMNLPKFQQPPSKQFAHMESDSEAESSDESDSNQEKEEQKKSESDEKEDK